MEIGFGEKADLVGILKLYEELHPEEKPIEIATAQSLWEDASKGGFQQHIIVKEEDEIIATCVVSIVPNFTRRGRSFAVIENVITAQKHRRKGIGKAMLTYALAYARERNCYKAILMSGNKREEAHLFYEGIGFNGTSKKGFEYRF